MPSKTTCGLEPIDTTHNSGAVFAQRTVAQTIPERRLFTRMADVIRASLLVFITCSIVIAGAESVSAKTFRFDYHKELVVTPGTALKIHNQGGNITIVGDKRLDQIKIDAVKTVHAVDENAAREVAGHIELRFSTRENEAVLETLLEEVSERQRSFWERLVGADDDWFGSVDFTISVPANMNITLNNSNGDIEIRGISGALDVSLESGEVRVNQFVGSVSIDVSGGLVELKDLDADVELTSTTADLKMTAIEGNVTIHGGAGNTVGEDITGEITVIQTSGDIKLSSISGDARLKATSGDLTIQQESGALDIFTHTGKVTVNTELFSERDYIVETLSGSISFSIPDNAGANVLLSTLSGDIDTKGLPMEVGSFSRREITGSVGAGGANVSLKSDSGDIRL